MSERGTGRSDPQRAQWLRELTDALPVPIAYLDGSLRYTFANEAFASWFGRKPDDVIGRSPAELLGPERSEPTHAHAEAALGGARVRVEQEFEHPDGTRRFLEISYLPDVREGGVVDGIYVLAVDVTPHRLAQRSAEEGARFMRRVMDAVFTYMAVLDPEGAVLEVNEAPLVAGGLRLEDVRGRAFWDTPWWTHEASVSARVQAAFERARRGEVVRFQDRARTAGDTRMDVDVQLAPLRDAAGHLTHVIASGADVTARLRAEEAQRRIELDLRESAERFRALADHISQLAWMADPSGYIFWYNRRWFEYTGTTLDEMKGWGWQKVHHPDHVDRVTALYTRQVIELREPWEDTFPLRGADGVYRWFLSRALPIRDEAGNVERWFGTNTDVTEQRANAEALRHAVVQRDEFLSVASHELRTPLTTLQLQLQSLQEVARASPASARKVERALRQTERLNALVDTLLDVTRIQSGRVTLHREQLDLRDLARDVVERMGDLAERAGCAVQLADHGPVIGSWDHGRVDQLLMNLLSNAVKYGAGQPVSIEVRGEKDRAVLRVTDRGIGIAPEDQARIFDRFERAVPTRNYGGLGLGLYVARMVAELHGGSIDVESAPGAGSTFTVTLPLD